MDRATGRQEEISYRQNIWLAFSDIHQQLNVTDPDHRDSDVDSDIYGSCRRMVWRDGSHQRNRSKPAANSASVTPRLVYDTVYACYSGLCTLILFIAKTGGTTSIFPLSVSATNRRYTSYSSSHDQRNAYPGDETNNLSNVHAHHM